MSSYVCQGDVLKELGIYRYDCTHICTYKFETFFSPQDLEYVNCVQLIGRCKRMLFKCSEQCFRVIIIIIIMYPFAHVCKIRSRFHQSLISFVQNFTIFLFYP